MAIQSAPSAAAATETTTPTRRRGKAPLTGRAREERRLGWMLCAPAVILMLLVTGYPIVYAIILSLQRYDLRNPAAKEFVGLSNYLTVLKSSTWWTDFLNTMLITVVSVGIELVLGMLIALVMHRAIFGRGPVRTAILIPYGIITVVSAFAWRYAFDAGPGFVVNWLNLQTPPLTTRWGTFIVIVLTEVWKTTPFMALLLLAGLSLVPEELQRAAKVDGASASQRFFKITLPLIMPSVLVALLFRTLDAFRIFDSVFVMNRGATNETVSILGYNTLINRVNLGLGSAISILIFICVIIIATLFVKGLGTSASPVGGGRR
jgi:multiple sugar transport system permease protein